jgi:hypothetical protein
LSFFSFRVFCGKSSLCEVKGKECLPRNTRKGTKRRKKLEIIWIFGHNSSLSSQIFVVFVSFVGNSSLCWFRGILRVFFREETRVSPTKHTKGHERKRKK